MNKLFNVAKISIISETNKKKFVNSKINTIFAAEIIKNYDRKDDYLLLASLLECSSTGTRNY